MKSMAWTVSQIVPKIYVIAPQALIQALLKIKELEG